MSVDLHVTNEWRKTERGTIHIERALLDNLEQSGNTHLPQWYELWTNLPVCGGSIMIDLRFPSADLNAHDRAINMMSNSGLGGCAFGCWVVDGDTIPNEGVTKNA